MNIEELVPLTNGLSVTAGAYTLVLDRARITPVTKDTIDMAFWIAGTDCVPRLRLSRDRITNATPEELARIVRRVAKGAFKGEAPGD